MEEKKFLDQTGVQYLWSKISMEDYPNNETLIAVLNAIDETKADRDEITNKQNKNVIVYRDSATKKASMTAPQIMERVRAGDNVYYTPSLSGGTLHSYLEGSNSVAFFYSNYIDNTKAMGTGVTIDSGGNIVSETFQLQHLEDTTIHITAAEREKWNNTYSKTETDTLLEAKANAEEPRFSGSMGMNHTGELGWTSVSLGFANEASGMYCFAEGMGNKSTGNASHAEGTGTTASLDAAHAEGYGTVASNVGSHAEGANTVASGYGSHAEGSGTIASIEGQHAEGKYNLEDTTAIHVVGNGTSNTARSNAHTLNLNGEAWFSGDVYTGSTSGTHKDEGSKKLATEEYVNTNIENALSNGSSSESVLIVHASPYEDMQLDIENPYEADKTIEEVFEAISNNQIVILEINDDGFLIHFNCSSYTPDTDLKFSAINNWYGEVVLETFYWSVDAENNCLSRENPITLLDNTSYDASYMPISGGTMEGSLILSQDPVEDLEAATKQYVDNLIGDINSILQSI